MQVNPKEGHQFFSKKRKRNPAKIKLSNTIYISFGVQKRTNIKGIKRTYSVSQAAITSVQVKVKQFQ